MTMADSADLTATAVNDISMIYGAVLIEAFKAFLKLVVSTLVVRKLWAGYKRMTIYARRRLFLE
jgi:hypothetical protein